MAPVVVSDLTKRYHRRGPVVLRAVSLELPTGSITALRGANGSGKSTLLRLLAGVTLPTSGRIAGRPAAVGYVPERFPADLRFTPREYLGWLASVRGLPGPARAATVTGLAERLGLPEVAMGQPMGDLSKGTTQKVALIQSLLVAPSLLLLDEAWTGLDVDAQRALTEIVSERRRDLGSVVVFADHGDRALGLRPDASYLVRDGAVSQAAIATPSPGAVDGHPMSLALAGPAERAGELAALAGVRSTAVRDGLVVLTVGAADTDTVLTVALARGWSVRRVGAAGAGGDA